MTNKRGVNLYLDLELFEIAKSRGLNVSKMVNDLLTYIINEGFHVKRIDQKKKKELWNKILKLQEEYAKEEAKSRFDERERKKKEPEVIREYEVEPLIKRDGNEN